MRDMCCVFGEAGPRELDVGVMVVDELLKYGTPGVVAYCLFLVGRGLAPAVQAYLPTWVSARQKREDRLVLALEASTRAMVEVVATLQGLRAEIEHVRAEAGELRIDVAYIAQELDLPRRRREKAVGSRQ